jgi:hypothetical protein
METLLRFYTAERVSGEVDARALRQFLGNPGKHVFVIWGDIGIGKSWFVRNQLHSAALEQPNAVRYGVIDMLRASKTDAKEKLEQQINAALEHYLSECFGSWEDGIRPYAEHRAKMRFGGRANDTEISFEVKGTINEILSLRGSARADALLDVVESAGGPPLFLAIDNLDRALDEEQHDLTDLVARMLRNAAINLIFPLRSSSGILLDESKILGFFEKQEMHLSAVDFQALLRPRFSMSETGSDLRNVRLPTGQKDSQDSSTFPELLQSFVNSEAGTFVFDLAGTNSRQLLDFMHSIIFSNQLDSVKNVTQPESCVAALLMHDSGSFSPELSYLVNLFDDDNPDSAGNALIRFRVLEFFRHAITVQSQDRWLTDYFLRLGYSPERVRHVIALFVGARLLKTDPPLTAEAIRNNRPAFVGSITRIEANLNQYFDKLLRSPWYFICAKRSIHIGEHLISKDPDGNDVVSDSNFIRFLKEEEDRERERIADWTRQRGRLGTVRTLAQPWAMARDTLNSRDRMGKGREAVPIKREMDVAEKTSNSGETR